MTDTPMRPAGAAPGADARPDVTTTHTAPQTASAATATPKRRRRQRKRGRVSTIESHERAAEIEADLARGISLRVLAKKYSLGHNALHRHMLKLRTERPEILTALAAENWNVAPAELEKLRTETGAGWLSQVRGQYSKLSMAMDRCLLAGDYGHGSQLAAQATAALRMIGVAVQELGTHSTTVTNNIVLAPGFLQLRSDLLKVLRRHPDAAADVVAVFRKVEGDAFAPAMSGAPMIEARASEVEHAS